MDSVIYGTLLAICASNNRCREAETFFQKMKDEGHSPNSFHYSSLLNAYSVNGNHVKADKLLEDIESAGLVPNKVCFQVYQLFTLSSEYFTFGSSNSYCFYCKTEKLSFYVVTSSHQTI